MPLSFGLRLCGTILLAISLTFSALSRAADNAAVLMYHRFAEDRYPSTNIRLEQFKAQLDYLRGESFNVIALADLLAALDGEADLPEKAVVITIDDAYRSVYEVAYPLFRQFGYPFTVFVASDPVDGGSPAYMSWDQMREMLAHGATYANHGAAHSSTLASGRGQSLQQRLAALRQDLERGARRLQEERLQPLPGAFAYPYGEYDTAAAGLVRELGYTAFGQQSGAVNTVFNDHRALPRYPMAENYADLSQFRTKVGSVALPVMQVAPWDPVTASPRPAIEVLLARNTPNVSQLACFVSGQGQVTVEWLEPGRRFRVGPVRDFPPGRRRVNCTAPVGDGRFQWFSHPWVVTAVSSDR